MMSLNGLKNIQNRNLMKRMIKDEDYEKIVEMGKEERKNNKFIC